MQSQNDPAGEDARPDANSDATADLAAQLQATQAELAQLREQDLRERAELENQRRRMQREVETARRFANERLLGDLLPVLDSLKAGLEAGAADAGRLREGMDITLKQLLKMASDHGLRTVHPLGLAFDPERHQAMSALPSPQHPPGTVLQVYQDGYVLNDRLLRPALVVVAAEPD